jgi:hypothetical protein
MKEGGLETVNFFAGEAYNTLYVNVNCTKFYTLALTFAEITEIHH